MRFLHTMAIGAAGFLLFAVNLLAGPSGAISGKVTFDGTPAQRAAIDMSHEPACAKMYSTPPLAETLVTGPNNALQNVVVYISAGAPDEPAPATQVIMSQKGCRFAPHVLAFQQGQELKVINEDETIHNIHPVAKANREWNKSEPPGGKPILESYDKAEFIPVKCNVHPWMHGTFAVLKNSHFMVTGENGTFTLPNLPPGKYTVSAWHESLGEQSQEITIKGNETQTVNFKFKAK